MAVYHKYSNSSMSRLNKCERDIKLFAIELLVHSKTDLSILKSTLRTIEEQRQFVDSGVSQTMDSKHLPNERGLSEAVDIGIYIPGVNIWKHPSITHMYEELHATAQDVARGLNINIRSGVCWSNLNTSRDFNDLLRDYRERKYRQGKRPFFDGPHFELIR